jgi:hypothetical protein
MKRSLENMYRTYPVIILCTILSMCFLFLNGQYSTAFAQAFDPQFARSGTVYGKVLDAITGKPVPNASITFAGQKVASDNDGYYVMRDIPATLTFDFYATRRFGFAPLVSNFIPLLQNGSTEILTATAANYTTYKNAQVRIRPQERTELNITLNPETPLTGIGGYRIVLTWKQIPYDLDSYLATPPINDTTWTIFYKSRGFFTKNPFTVLDIDARNGFGPETITIRRLFPGTYKYSIENVNASSNSNAVPLGGCGATVEVYSDTGFVQRFVVPETGGRLLDWWHVFTIDGATGRITPVNVLDSNEIGRFQWNTALAAIPAKEITTKTNADEQYKATWNYGNGKSEEKFGPFSDLSLAGSTTYTTNGTFDVGLTLTAANGYTASVRKPITITSIGAVGDAAFGRFSTGDIIGTQGIGGIDDLSFERSLDNAIQRFTSPTTGIWREPVKGIVADTASRLMIVGVAPDTLTPITFTLDGEGSLSTLNRLQEQRKQIQLRARRVGQSDPAMVVLYTPPATLRLPVGISETTITIRIASGTLGTVSVPLKLMRPPVVLVHDAWSDPSAWERGNFANYLRQVGYRVFTADYGTANVGNFNPRASVPSLGISAVTTAITQARNALREQGIVVQRVDVVAHGLGGLMARGYIQNEARLFANYAGSVRRFITLGTPHNGTPLGGLLWSRRNAPVASGFRIADIFSAMGFPIGEAHRALGAADNDASLQSLRAVEVNSHAITANWRPQATSAAETMNTFLRFLQSPNEYRAGVVFYDSLFGNQAHDLIADVSSQRGGLSGQAVTEFTGLAHSDLPFAGQSQTLLSSSPVMRRVNELLSSTTSGDFSPTLPVPALPTWNTRFPTDGTPSVARGGIRITQPVRGLVVPANSFSPIQMSAEATGGVTLREIVFIIENVGIGTIIGTGTGPYSIPFTLQRESPTGRLRVIALAREVETGVLVADTTSITVQAPGKARDMIVTPGALQLVAGTPQGIAQLQVTSLLTDNSSLTITKAAQGTEYTSLTGRATVTPNGVVTGFGSMTNPISYDTVLVKNGSITLRVPVRIFGVLTPTSVRENTNQASVSEQTGNLLTLSPNPASSETILSYTLPAASKVRIDVYDILGRHILAVCNTFQEAGRHALPINTESLAAGNYVIRTQTLMNNTNQQSTTRMTIIP